MATTFSVSSKSSILGNIDFAVSPKDGLFKDEIFFLWAEAKRGNKEDIYESFVQLILTIGQAHTHEKLQPPAFLGAFDAEKIAFIPYSKIHEVFYQNDFNWNVTPSDHETKEFRTLYEKVRKIIENDIPWETYLFDFEKDEKELRRFIKDNFVLGKLGTTKIEITENNFVHIFYKWLETVKPKIAVKWETEAYKYKIYERDFYLADLISENDETIENLLVQLRKTYYKTEVDLRNEFFKEIRFTDGGEAYRSFWAKYHRPPQEIFRQEIRNRQDLLVLPNFRERNGAFFTPPQWVELSQQYIADVLGETWQDEYYVWDCAAGTGNLLNGLTRPYRIFASTLDSGDVKIMHEDIDNRRSILLKEHVFQFDFLNDDFSQLPDSLQKIIANPEKRKKLIIYINPPYAEAGSTVKRDSKVGVTNDTMVHKKYCANIGTYAKREMFVQFFVRIYREIPGAALAEFSTLKILQAPYFSDFRNFFLAKLEKMFVVPAKSFENVKGQFRQGNVYMIFNKRISKTRICKIRDDKFIDS
ncbi:MAG: hypothetical protein LBR34_12040 [Prevotella sp.]|nr:hypothetical protein [Prevotella sp.]